MRPAWFCGARLCKRAEELLLLAGSLGLCLAGVAIAWPHAVSVKRHNDMSQIIRASAPLSGIYPLGYGRKSAVTGPGATGLLQFGWPSSDFFDLFGDHYRSLPGPAGLRPYGIAPLTRGVLLFLPGQPLAALSQASPLRSLAVTCPLEQRRNLKRLTPSFCSRCPG